MRSYRFVFTHTCAPCWPAPPKASSCLCKHAVAVATRKQVCRRGNVVAGRVVERRGGAVGQQALCSKQLRAAVPEAQAGDLRWHCGGICSIGICRPPIASTRRTSMRRLRRSQDAMHTQNSAHAYIRISHTPEESARRCWPCQRGH